MRNTALCIVCFCLLTVRFFGVRQADAQEWMVDIAGENPLSVQIQNLNPVDSMTGVTVWVDFIPPGWSIVPDSIALGSIAASSTSTANFTVSVGEGTLPGTTSKIRLRLTDDQGQTWTAVEKAALEIEVEVSQTLGAVTQYGGAGSDTVSAIVPTHDGGSIIAGQSNSFVKGKRSDLDLWVLKLDCAGACRIHANGLNCRRAD